MGAPSATFAPTSEPTESHFPTAAPVDPAPITPTVPPTPEPTDVPSDTPTDSFTLSPIAETSSAVMGTAAPGGTPARTEDILTVAEFVQTLNIAMELLVNFFEGTNPCIVETSAVQYAVSDSVCTAQFTAAQLTGSFCYSFRTKFSAGLDFEDCEVNAAAELAAEGLIDGDFATKIGPVADSIEIVFVPTNSPTNSPTESYYPSSTPTEAPNEGTEPPTSETVEPTSETVEPTSETVEPTFGTTTEGPTSGTTTEGPAPNE